MTTESVSYGSRPYEQATITPTSVSLQANKGAQSWEYRETGHCGENAHAHYRIVIHHDWSYPAQGHAVIEERGVGGWHEVAFLFGADAQRYASGSSSLRHQRAGTAEDFAQLRRELLTRYAAFRYGGER
jgi:hypothetical protein